jgi:hypothetical protein
VRRKALRRASAICISLITVSLLLSGVPVGGTFAFFDGETVNAGSVFAGGWVTAPTAAVGPTISGYDATLGWTAGTHGVAGEQILGFDNTTTSNCTGVTYTALTTISAATTYTDSNRGSTANGDWYCYEVASANGGWTSPTALTYSAVQLGLVATALTITNVATNNSIAATDTVKITFNQQATGLPTTTNIKVCAIAGTLTSGEIILGDTSGGTGCSTSDGSSIGTITGIAVGTPTRAFTTSTISTTGATTTITIGGTGTNTESGTAKFTPVNSIKSFATTDQATICIAASTNCQPTTTGHF